MAFPSNNGSVPLTLNSGWALAQQIASNVKISAQSLVTQIAAGPISSQQIIGLPALITGYLGNFNQVAAIPNIAAYAQTQVNNAAENISAEFTAMINALTAVSTWITTNFPKDASNNLLYVQFGPGGVLQYTSFTTAQLGGLTAALNALIATIN